jgi:hypothetical protein
MITTPSGVCGGFLQLFYLSWITKRSRKIDFVAFVAFVSLTIIPSV